MADGMKMTCPACGSLNPEEATQCITCGEEFGVDGGFPGEVAETTPSHADVQAVPPSSTEEIPPKSVAASPPATAGSSVAATQRSGSTAPQRGTKKVVRPQIQAQRPRQSSSGVTFSTGQLVTIGVAFVVLITSIVLYYEQRGGVREGAGQTVQQDQGPRVNLGQIESQRAYVDANPDDMAATLALANAMHDGKLTDQAVIYYKKYLLKNPSDPDARVDLGICYFELGDNDAAIQEMTLAVKDSPSHQLGHFNLGIVTMSAGRMDEAKSWFEKTVALDATSSAGQGAQRFLQEKFK